MDLTNLINDGEDIGLADFEIDFLRDVRAAMLEAAEVCHEVTMHNGWEAAALAADKLRTLAGPNEET